MSVSSGIGGRGEGCRGNNPGDGGKGICQWTLCVVEVSVSAIVLSFSLSVANERQKETERRFTFPSFLL